ncbi:MAG: hypothetical protein DSY90_06130 [Deltaproteobacteria bacterium]|nr:MAG: hypothetical protein DSY90_06130 [Deltaproteobacteria bacterium]
MPGSPGPKASDDMSVNPGHDPIMAIDQNGSLPVPDPVSAGQPGRNVYGWIIVAVCALLLAITFGISYSFGIFLPSLQAEFSWNRAGTSSIFSVYLLFVGLFSIWGGRFCDRFGPRIVVLGMGIMSGLSLVLTSQVTSVWQLYFTYSVLFSLGTGAMYIVAMSTASRWISAHRAGALGIIGAGGSLGTVGIAPLSAWLISSFDWRKAYLIMGMVAWSALIPLSLFLKNKPSANAPHPAGAPPLTHCENTGPSLGAMMKTQPFRLLSFSWFSYAFCLYMVMGHLVPAMEDVGVAPFQAATALSLMTVASIPSRVIAGFVADRVEKKKVITGFSLLIAVALLFLAWASQGWHYYLFAVVFGVAYGGIDPPLAAQVGDFFGLSKVGQIMGILMISWGIGSALGPYIAGLAFDLTGTYQPAFLLSGLIMLWVPIWTRLSGK